MSEETVGVVLAGGMARRFDGVDKCLIELCDKPLVEHVIERTAPQVDRLILNTNNAPERFQGYGLDIIADVVEGHAGPLAGILSALEWTREHVPSATWVASFPTDAPLLPVDLVAKMHGAIAGQGTDMACAISNGRTHPVIALWPVALASDLRTALVDKDIRKIDRFTAQYKISHVDFAAIDYDPFFNINTQEDLAQAAELLSHVNHGNS